MRRFAATLLGVCAGLLLGADSPPLAEEPAAKPPAPRTCSLPEVPPLPNPASERDVADRHLRHRLRSRECELEARRHSEPGGAQSCYYGPAFVRITNQRYEELWQKYKSDPPELWHAFLSEPDDPNLPPIEIRVMSKSGPSCSDDYERKLQAEIDELMKQLNIR